MEEEKAAAYYEELVAKGGGAARFKQGLGFSSAPAVAKPEVKGLGNFVRAAGSPKRDADDGQASRLEGIQDKQRDDGRSSKHGRHRSRSPVRRECRSRDRSGSRERSRNDHRRRSRSDRSPSGDNSRRCRSHRRDSRSPSARDSHKRDGSLSPKSRRHSSRRDDSSYSERRNKRSTEGRKADRDYSKLIPNYDSMTPAERVKAKMSLQLSETVAKDKEKGMSDGWERFDFDKNARLDGDVEPEPDYLGDRTGAPDDTAFLKNTSQSFLSYASQATREKRTEAAHEAAMFGVPAANTLDHESDSQEDISDRTESKAQSHVVSEQVIAMQQDSWQERVRKMKAAKSAAAAAT